jgi:tRNA pseudouridine55 synthase
MDGILLVDKPAGWTSFDAVAKVRGILRTANRQAMAEGRAVNLPKRVKVGHTGTLDPLATGLLVLLVGKYTKRAPELTKLDKTYEVTMKLGETSTTGDDEGEKSPVSDRVPEKSEIEAALRKFTGDIMQTPPIFSAMKINGVRAYKLAREGKEVVIEPRPARIDRLELVSYEYPFVRFDADVSSGTYIRSLVEDLGAELRTGAYMPALRRTRVGRFDIADAVGPSELTSELVAQRLTVNIR